MNDYLIINCEKSFKNEMELAGYLQDHPTVKTLFFLYWKWKVPFFLLERYRCVGFHTGPILEGKGRGGSPIQNLKKLGVKITTLCAFEMNSEFDEGKIVLAVPLSLQGAMGEIWERIEKKVPEMISYLLAEQPEIPERFTREMAL